MTGRGEAPVLEKKAKISDTKESWKGSGLKDQKREKASMVSLFSRLSRVQKKEGKRGRKQAVISFPIRTE